jgi:8-oxo-dGTP diphosphatase
LKETKVTKVIHQDYVAGFLFSPYKNKVALILKNKPKWQAGKYNAIGGKIEKGETPLQAMQREFEEEAGTKIKDWAQYAVLQGEGFKVYFFWAADPKIKLVKSMTDEVVEVFDTGEDKLPANLMTNVRWLIEMALSMPAERASSFVVTEVAA